MSKLNLGDSLILNSDIVVGGGEVKTGATFNGKPVYAKTFSTDAFTGNTNWDSVIPNTNITNISKLVKMYGTLNNANAFLVPIPGCFGKDAANYFVFLRYDMGSGVRLQGRMNWSGNIHIEITVEYTKTTD